MAAPMSVSRSGRERGNPPPRRKACGACIKAKRRCDMRQPACLRCAHRGLPCVYPRQHGGAAPRYATPKAHDVVAAPASTPVAVAPLPPSTVRECTPLPAMPACSESGRLAAWVPDLWFPRVTPEPLTGLDGTCSPTLAWPELVGPEPFPSWEPDDMAAALEVQDPSPADHPSSTALGRWQVPRRTLVTPTIRDGVVRNHLRYALDELMAAPRRMVLQNGTPWAPAALWHPDGPAAAATMPRCLQDAHAGCALYLAKNAANAPIVLRHLDARAAELAAAPLPPAAAAAPHALLAHVQAALLYLLVQLFDGDVAARAAAEARLPGFEVAVRALASTLPPCSVPPAAAAAADILAGGVAGPVPGGQLRPQRRRRAGSEARNVWAAWLLAESVQRTCLVGFSFLQAYRLLSGAALYACADPSTLPVSRLGWTVFSARLWEADGAGAFARAWADQRHFRVTPLQLDGVLARGRPEDLDVCSKMLLTSMMGIDEVEAWLTAHGGQLR